MLVIGDTLTELWSEKKSNELVDTVTALLQTLIDGRIVGEEDIGRGYIGLS